MNGGWPSRVWGKDNGHRLGESVRRTLWAESRWPFIFWVVFLSLFLLNNDGQSADFAKDVRPILQRACFECHGADKQESGLRLDRKDSALKGGDSGRAFIAGKPDESELLRRVRLPRGHDGAMPPRGKALTGREIKLLHDWIANGANWPENADSATHWAYVKPVRPTVPDLKSEISNLKSQISKPDLRVENPIDAFILVRLRSEGLQPSPEADRATLARRVSLDLIGLPPSPAEVEAFVRDADPSAYEKFVDRLLKSEEFGVKWARPWLDLARYADSHGFQRDDLRDVWAYRDWVVKALNADMPFDQFTIEQIAGDLLPNPTQDQLVATGFHRCTPTNVEAGTEPEESRINQVIDRVNTTGAVWLGTTLECAQCHNHKYDPFTQRDYYRLLAYFNNTEAEAERSNPKVPGSIRFLGTSLPLTDPSRDAEREMLKADIAKLNREIAALAAAENTSAETHSAEKPTIPKNPKQRKPQVVASAANPAGSSRVEVLKVTGFDAASGAESESQADGSILVTGDVPDKETYTIELQIAGPKLAAIQLEALRHPSLPGGGPGRGDSKRTNFVLHEFEAELIATDGTAKPLRFQSGYAGFEQAKFSAQGAIDSDPKTAWAIAPAFDRSHKALFTLAEPIDVADGTELKVRLIQNFGSGRVIGCLRISGVFRSADEVVAALKKHKPGKPGSVSSRTSESTQAASESVRGRTHPGSPKAELEESRANLQKQLAALNPGTTEVMRELKQPRMSAIFQRGEYTQPGEPVVPGTPAVLPAAPDGPPNRLTLARWLVSPDNPLTARVVVNRWWAEIFGHGLVTTVEDFGIKGEPPTHPELLDWLACELVEGSGLRDEGQRQSPTDQLSSPSTLNLQPSTMPWSMKHILKRIVMSSTYRQSSRVTPGLLARDDQNLLYARGPRFRLDAEAIRDNALSIAGLLSLQKGGPSIRPPQPDGLWRKVGGQQYDYEVSSGEQQFRRGLYVVLKRGSPYPSFVNFDASSRMACVVKRSRSNTPLQALTLFNDPVYVEAARAFARRILADQPQAETDTRLDYAFRIALARTPRPNELAVLRTLLDRQLQRHHNNELAAWTAITSALFNLDETITKG